LLTFATWGGVEGDVAGEVVALAGRRVHGILRIRQADRDALLCVPAVPVPEGLGGARSAGNGRGGAKYQRILEWDDGTSMRHLRQRAAVRK
jgi:hypothetical protein